MQERQQCTRDIKQIRRECRAGERNAKGIESTIKNSVHSLDVTCTQVNSNSIKINKLCLRALPLINLYPIQIFTLLLQRWAQNSVAATVNVCSHLVLNIWFDPRQKGNHFLPSLSHSSRVKEIAGHEVLYNWSAAPVLAWLQPGFGCAGGEQDCRSLLQDFETAHTNAVIETPTSRQEHYRELLALLTFQ